ncbi:MAG TPA: CoF synthetase [Polyangia bacterium]|jgi:phenylacetate-CoA ligase
MNSRIDPWLGWALNTVGGVALSSWNSYRLLHAPVVTEEARQWVSRKRAAAAFYRARRTVPAYRAFLGERQALEPARFEDIPPMDKESYVKRWPLEALCQGGALPLRGAVIDESSGSSGTASNWVRGEAERSATRRLIQYAARATFGDDSFVLLNAFALGPWATGMNVSMSLVDRAVLKSIGPDAKKVLATLELLGPRYRYVITGYPPFLKALVETATLDWSRYDICAVVGGEGMSEPLRAALNRCFRKTISSFGASDLEINLAVESDFSIALRQALAANPALARDLYGAHEALPMIFQYDPLNCFVESDGERNLLFTLNRLENVSPRIRYNLHDRGLSHPFSFVRNVLRDHGVDLGPAAAAALPLPLLFHWGRQENAVAFYGCKLTPEDLQNVVMRVPALGRQVANFALHPFEDARANKRLELWFELSPGLAVPPADDEALRDGVLSELAAVNQDFRESIRMVPPDGRPTLKFFPFGDSPISGQDIRVKKRYIV